MSRFSALDLSAIPVPDTIEAPSFEDELARLKSLILEKDASFAEVLNLETDPLVIILELLAEERIRWLARRNDDIRQHTLPNAFGTGLDNHGALVGLTRAVVVPAEPDAAPPVEEVLEDDERFRARILDALEQFSTAGPEGAYVSHALSAAPAVADVSAISPTFFLADIDQAVRDLLPEGAIVLVVQEDAGLENPMPGDVAVTILSSVGDGTASAPEIAAVEAHLSEDVVPMTDRPRVRAAEIIDFQIEAELTLLPEADAAIVLEAATKNAETFTERKRLLGHDIVRSAIIAALHVEGVYSVDLQQPAASLVILPYQAAHCTEIEVTIGGIDV